MRVGVVVLAAIIGVLAGRGDTAMAADIQVYSSGAPGEAAKAIGREFAASSNHRLDVAVGPPATIQSELATGRKIDVVILPKPIVSTLTGNGVLRGDGVTNVARVGVGVVVRAGAPVPNVADVAAIRQLLTNAQSIAYPDPGEAGGGSTGLAVARTIEKLGMTDVVRPKLTVKSAIDGGVALVASGQVEVGIFNISEILLMQGVTMAGPLPAELQHYILFAAAIPAKSLVPEPALGYIKQLADPVEGPVWQKAGLEPVNAAH